MSERDGDPLVRLLARHDPVPPVDADRLWQRIGEARTRRVTGRSSIRKLIGYRPVWLAAAAITLIVIASMTRPEIRTVLASEVVAPARTWTLESAAKVSDWLRMTPPAPPPISVDSPRIRPYAALVPSGSLEVVIEHCQPEGLMEVRVHQSELAYLEITDGHAREMLSQLDGGLRIHNGSDSRASYRLRVPEGVRHLVVRIAAGSVVVPVGVPDPRGWVLHLQPPDAATGTVGHCRG